MKQKRCKHAKEDSFNSVSYTHLDVYKRQRYLETKTIPKSQRRFFHQDEKEKMIFLWEV